MNVLVFLSKKSRIKTIFCYLINFIREKPYQLGNIHFFITTFVTYSSTK